VDKIIHTVAGIAITARNWLMYNPGEVYYIGRFKNMTKVLL
jgi:hypothetical protein